MTNEQQNQYHFATFATWSAMLGLERLELRRLRFDLLMCYKIIYNHVNINRGCFFTFATYPGTSASRFSHSFDVRIIRVWNNLPNDVVTAANIYLFKNRLSKTNLAYTLRGCKGVRCPPIFLLSNLIDAGWL